MLTTLRKRRLEHDLTVKQLAAAMGYSPELVSAVERLHARPSNRFRGKASNVLGVAESELFPEWDNLVAAAQRSNFEKVGEATAP